MTSLPIHSYPYLSIPILTYPQTGPKLLNIYYFYKYKGPFTHAIFVALLNATFVASVNLRRFQCNSFPAYVQCLLPDQFFPKSLLSCMKFRACPKTLRYRGDKSHENRFKFTLDISIANMRARQNCIEKCDKNPTKHRMCKWPLMVTGLTGVQFGLQSYQ